MRDVVRVEIELEQGDERGPRRARSTPPRPAAAVLRARSGASRPAAQFSAPPAAPAAPAAHPHPRRPQDGEGSPAVPQGRQHVGGHLRVLRNRKQFESNHDKQIRKDKESAMRRARARRGQRRTRRGSRRLI